MLRRALLVFAFATSPLAASAIADESPAPLQTRRVDVAESLPTGAALGRIRLRGMLELPSEKFGNLRLSQLSALAWDDDDEILYALSDKGRLFHLQPKFVDDTLTEVTLLNAFVLTDHKGNKPLRSWLADTEGMDIVNGRNGRKGDAELLISFEHTPRIIRYRPDGKAIEALKLPAVLADADKYERPNKMLEAVCVDAKLGILTTPEVPFEDDAPGTTRIFNLNGKSWRYPLAGEFHITAMECLGNGQLLVLERDFGMLRNASALRLVTLPATPTSAPLVPITVAVLNASDGHQTDNFEGLTRHRGNRFFMVSDDNDLFVQRTLLLYFELLPL